jgi:NAD+ synthase (glutamine-hydrolysing)
MTVTVSLAQINPTTGDIDGNTEAIKHAIEQAEQEGADLVVFPEMAVTGYCISDMVEDDEFVRANEEAIEEIADETGETAAVIGFVEQDGDDRYNAAAVVQYGDVQGIARKNLLPNYRYFDDERYFEAGEDPTPVAINVDGETVSLGVSICEDMWDEAYETSPIDELADQGADIIININASPFEVDKRDERASLIQEHIEETELPFIYCNTTGVADVGKNILPFDGESLIYNQDSDLVAQAAQFEEDHVTADIELAGVTETADIELDPQSREEQIYRALTMSIRDYMDKTGFEKVVEPISGGIDSSLGLALCADALGPENVIAYNLPSTVNTDTTKDIAEELADNFGIEYREMPIQSIYDETIDTYEDHARGIESTIAKENIYARVRGMLMMLESNNSPEDEPAMLVNNGNETELALGYVTLYGDMDGGVALLGDVSKTDVYRVAEYVNERHGEEMIPEEVFEIEPSAELSPGQEDPFDYPVVAPLVDDFLEHRYSPQDIIQRFEERDLDDGRYVTEGDDSVYERYDRDSFRELVYATYRRFQNASFKRVQAPPVVAVSGRAFGTDFREPIINRWDGG